MNDNLRNAEIDKMTDTEELERKIEDGEQLLIQAESKRTAGWLPLIISLGLQYLRQNQVKQEGLFE